MGRIRIIDPEEEEQRQSFGANFGGPFGCFWVLIGLAIFISFDKILDLIALAIKARCQ